MNNTMSIEEFCGLHAACADGRAWALENCQSMQHAWDTIKPDWLIWVATRDGVLTDRELRKFAVWCGRQVEHLMTDPRSVAALEVSERYADGLAMDEELTAARDAAGNAARAAAGAAAWDAAGDVARDAARAAAGAAAWAAARAAAGAAAWAAARDAAWAAAWAAARDAAGDVAEDVARDAALTAARDAQSAWLRENTKPNFGKTK